MYKIDSRGGGPKNRSQVIYQILNQGYAKMDRSLMLLRKAINKEILSVKL